MTSRPRQQITPFALIVCAGVIVCLPCLLFGFPYYGDDSATHAVSFSRFSEQLWQGDPYPRWLAKMNSGLGSVYFLFYSPIPHYLTSTLRPLFPNDSFGWSQLGVGACAAVVASGLTFFFWIRNHARTWPATIASIVYMALPYHLNIDLYTRGAYAELWVFACMPLMLYAIDLLKRSYTNGVVWVSVTNALLITTNLPIALIFSPAAVGYALATMSAEQRLKKISVFGSSFVLGVALAAIYLVPAIALKKFTFLSEGVSGHYFYGNWFLFTGLNWSSVRSEIFWFTLEVGVLAVLAFLVADKTKDGPSKRHVYFWIAVAVSSFLLMTSLSKPVWMLIPTLREVQFPWRFNAVLSVAAAALLAHALSENGAARMRLLLRVVLLGLIVIWLYDLGRRSWFSYPAHYFDQAVVRERNRWLEQQRDQNEFRPRWVVSIREKELEALSQRLGKSNETPGVALLQGDGIVSILHWDRQAIVLAVDISEPQIARVSQFYFPGWTATLDGQNEAEVNPSVPGGLVSVAVPAGKHTLVLRRVATRPEKIGTWISASALTLLVCFGVLSVARKTKSS